MEHFIIIRFSVIFKNSPEFKKKKSLLLSKKRLDFRFNLFEKFCLPSLKNQTLNDFKIIIIYDKNLDLEYKNRLKELCNDEYFILHEWDINDNLSSNNWLKKYMKNKEADYIITTRLDDDDMINFNINKRLKNYINRYNCKHKITSFGGGNFLNYYNKNRMELFRIRYNSLAVFMTIIDRLDSPNIYGYSHDTHKMPKRIINFINSFIVVNHEEENDNRLDRFKKKKGNLVNLEYIYNILK